MVTESSRNTRSTAAASFRRGCEAWDWRQSNGALRDMVCRGLLLMFERVISVF
jgi:hypothetical protein